MKIVLLNQSDYGGGAFIAGYRFHKAFLQAGVNSTMLVADKKTDDFTVLAEDTKLGKVKTKVASNLDSLPLKLYPQRQNTMFSSQWFPNSVEERVQQINPELVHLHWINSGYLRIETLGKFNKPLVWTFHDMWPFTGGCHVSKDCLGYTKDCGSCPQLHSNKQKDLSRWIWQRKFKVWKNLNLSIVTPSHWLADCVRSSSLFQNFRIRVIHHGLDLKKYQSIEKNLARKILNLPTNKQLVMFGASGLNLHDPNKGFRFLSSALQSLDRFEWKDKIELVIFGSSRPRNPIELGFKTHYIGRFHDDISLAIAYSAADVIVVPSQQESFGLVACESLACSTPVVAFNTTGLKDIIDHQYNGYLATPFEYEDLAYGITWVLSNEYQQKLSGNAREKAEREFNIDKQTNLYLSLFAEILGQNKN